MKIASRPDMSGGKLTAASFDSEELELIAAFMNSTRLGHGSRYKQAAFRIINKISDHMNDLDFSQVAAGNVGINVRVMDSAGNLIEIIDGDDVEYEV